MACKIGKLILGRVDFKFNILNLCVLSFLVTQKKRTLFPKYI